MSTNATFTIDLSTPEGMDLLRRITSALTGGVDVVVGAASAAAPAPAPAPTRRGRGKAAEAEKVDVLPEAPHAAAPVIDHVPGDEQADMTMAEEIAAESAAEAVAVAAPTREDMLPPLRKLVQGHVDKHGIPATAEVLKRFGAARLADVKDDDLGTLSTALELSMDQPAKADATASLI